MAKGKRMTAREKAERARIRKELRERGLLPQPKKPLNRKKLSDEAREIIDSAPDFDFYIYLTLALELMIGHRDRGMHLTLEAVGAAKAVKIAKRWTDLCKADSSENKPQTIAEMVDAVEDIVNA